MKTLIVLMVMASAMFAEVDELRWWNDTDSLYTGTVLTNMWVAVDTTESGPMGSEHIDHIVVYSPEPIPLDASSYVGVVNSIGGVPPEKERVYLTYETAQATGHVEYLGGCYYTQIYINIDPEHNSSMMFLHIVGGNIRGSIWTGEYGHTWSYSGPPRPYEANIVFCHNAEGTALSRASWGAIKASF